MRACRRSPRMASSRSRVARWPRRAARRISTAGDADTGAGDHRGLARPRRRRDRSIGRRFLSRVWPLVMRVPRYTSWPRYRCIYRMAAGLPVASLRLLPQRGLCPCCGSTPVVGCRNREGSNAGAPVSALFAMFHRMESRPSRVHHLRRDALSVARGDRGRFRHGQGRDLQRVPHLREDAVPGGT